MPPASPPPIFATAAQFPPQFQPQLQPHASYRQENRSPGIAAVMSFVIPGAGQIFNGQIGKGIMMCCLFAVGIFFSLFFIGIPILVGVWAWAIYDAYAVAENPPSRRRRRH